MSIRRRILAGCLTLTLLSALLGASGVMAEQRLGRLAIGIYDNALMAVSYLRAAQVEFGSLATGAGPAPSSDEVDDLLGDLDVVVARAMSARGRKDALALRREVAVVLPRARSDHARTVAVQQRFERLVERFADDGFHDRRNVGILITAQLRRTGALLAGSLLVALLVTLVLARSIAPPIGRAVRIAQSIASGRLDNPIAVGGKGETADLLRALALMQASIAGAMARIEALMDEQASSHADEIAVHNAQMSAALENMNQGLCLFDPAGRLIVFNRRFAEMFAAPMRGSPASEVLGLAGSTRLLDLADGQAASLSCELADGRTIAVSQRPVENGGSVATFEDLSERRATEARLAHLARHDGLTNLPNRLSLQEHLDDVFARVPDRGSLAMLCLDLDRFKTVNDTLGHPVGDSLLRAVAGRLRSCCGDEDFVARLGGDEFAIVQVGQQPNDASILAQRLVETCCEPFGLDGHAVGIGLSVGIALADGAPSGDELLKCADLALDRAKADGRGCLRFFAPETDLQVRRRRALEIELRHALENGEFEVFYQPQVSAAAGLSGFEALLRWRHPARGLVSPADFIPVAEEIGLIGAIGAWVLRQACLSAAGWPEELKVAVNLSPAQFRGRLVAEDVRQALMSSGLEPRRLEVEITEAVLMQEDEAVLQTLEAIRSMGVRIAMDDFGTGYSSLATLSRFPFDKIKIDQSFVRGMSRQGSLSIVRAIIGLGHSLGIAINAEGVETQEQRARLTVEGCGELQGYLFGRPGPEGEVRESIRRLGGAARTAAAEAAA